MTERVNFLIDFHATIFFGSRENFVRQHKEARAAYFALTENEIDALTREVISRIDKGINRFDQVLCCLACFRPNSLTRFHGEFVNRRLIYPGVIFHGATSETAHQLISLCEQGNCHDHSLVALAWIGDAVVQAAFAKWRESPPAWTRHLHIPPHRYAEEAGWEFTTEGKRRDLFHPVAFPLVTPSEAVKIDDSVLIGTSEKETCPWCTMNLVALLDFAAIERVFPDQGTGRVRIVTCQACGCFSPLFLKIGREGSAVWHERNHKPKGISTDPSNWEAFPESQLVMTQETRHFMEAANWSKLPGVAFSQVGGLPTWIQDAEFPTCPDCSQEMPFIGQISNEDFMEFGEGIYYAFWCHQYRVSATCFQQT